MEHASEDAPLAAESRSESQQVLIQPNGATGGSNSRALKIAGITTLVCLLVSAQVFTAYLVFDQRQQIQGLQMNNQKMLRQMERRVQVAPEKMAMPIRSLPLLDSFDDEESPSPATPKASPKVQLNKTPPSVKEQLQEFMKDFELPHFNKSFLANLQDLKQQINETTWNSFESWLRHCLIFQTAQKASTPNPAMTKCQTEAAADVRGMLGAYRPQCDEQGNYRSMQCRPSTRRCWCVDQSGTLIQGSHTYGRPNCDQFLSAGSTTPDVQMMADLFDYK
ncbi:H-2 class II histocompatibility antigen gamma chain-like [Eucyclogobius newberryi]|uniref:H-2 class II histocompatibility antigen gamma chain-like n=1 Tax=Eucyclogobius newberryi TaxID=166745 RepID=UPI003B5BF53B